MRLVTSRSATRCYPVQIGVPRSNAKVREGTIARPGPAQWVTAHRGAPLVGQLPEIHLEAAVASLRQRQCFAPLPHRKRFQAQGAVRCS